MLQRASLRAAALLGVLALVPGCTARGPSSGELRGGKTPTGASIGATAGASAGLIFGDEHRERRKRALIGAGVGALADGSVGAYMDRQEGVLRERLAGTGVSVSRIRNDVVIDMPGNLTFGFDREVIRGDFYAVLSSVAVVLKEFDQTVIEIVGHTDSTGGTAYNQALSERRADAVRRYLRTQGISDLRIVALGYGESRPAGSNATVGGRERNRRVELTLIPLTS